MSSANPGPAAPSDPQLQKAVQALRENKPQAAEIVLRKFLEAHPDDPAGLTLMAETIMRFDRYAEAGELLARAVALAPNSSPPGTPM